MYIFEISSKRLMPHSTYLKKNSFLLLEGTMNLFEESKRSKMEETAQYFEKRCSARDWDGKDYLRIIPRVVW
jgi:hypothetical protein